MPMADVPPLPTVEDLDTLPADALLAFLVELSALQARAALRLRVAGSRAPSNGGPERLLTVRQAAARCGMSADWLYRHKDALPFVRRLGRTVRVSEGALIRWMESRRR
jgi:excisionase family DNA binding protein